MVVALRVFFDAFICSPFGCVVACAFGLYLAWRFWDGYTEGLRKCR